MMYYSYIDYLAIALITLLYVVMAVIIKRLIDRRNKMAKDV